MLWQPHICKNIISLYVPQKLKIDRSINIRKEETQFNLCALTSAIQQNWLRTHLENGA